MPAAVEERDILGFRLTEKSRKRWVSDSRLEDNRHVQQTILNKRAGYKSVCSPRTDFDRVLLPDMKEEPYRRRQQEEKTVIHWGQRKLMLSEIEFLSLHGHRSRFVVYAGGAPGTHMEVSAI